MMVVASACGGPSLEASRIALATATQAVKATDDAFEPIYDAAGDDALETSDGWDERDAKLAPFDRVEAALEKAHGLLLVAEASLDVGSSDSALRQAACAAEALGELRAALRDVDVTPPPALSKADAALRALGSACRSQE